MVAVELLEQRPLGEEYEVSLCRYLEGADALRTFSFRAFLIKLLYCYFWFRLPMYW